MSDEIKPDAVPAAAPEVEEEEEDLDIESGYLHKKGTNPINPWNKRYFAFGNEPIDINNLQALHKRNERKVVKAAAPAPAPAPAAEEHAEASTSTAVAAPTEPAVSAKDVYETANKDLLVNIAHATQTGKGLLFYHKSEQDAKVANPLGVINLKDVNSVERVEKTSKNHSFVVNTKSRDYHFSAGTSQEAKGWVKAIKEKSDEAKAAKKQPYDADKFNDVYQKLVAREAFEHAKATNPAVVSDADYNSDGEPEDIEVGASGTPIIKKRKSFFGFSAVATSSEKKKADGVTTETNTENVQDLTHIQDEGVEALKTHESSNAVSKTSDGTTSTAPAPAAAAAAPPSPKKAGGFKLFGAKKPAVETAVAAPATPADAPLSVETSKAEALKAVDDAVEASKKKAAEVTAGVPATPPPAEKKPSFFENLFKKKPAAPAAPATVVVPNSETVVVSTESNLSDVVTAEGEARSESHAGFFSKLTKGSEGTEVEVKSAEVSTEDVQTAEGSNTHVEHVEGTDAKVENDGKEQYVDLSTTDETVATSDKVSRKPSLLKVLGGVIRGNKAPAADATAEEPAAAADASEETVKAVEVAEPAAVEAAA